jgi:hypothetical protein
VLSPSQINRNGHTIEHQASKGSSKRGFSLIPKQELINVVNQEKVSIVNSRYPPKAPHHKHQTNSKPDKVHMMRLILQIPTIVNNQLNYKQRQRQQ